MPPASRKPLDIIAAIGLALGAVFGLAGTMVSQAPVRQTFWAIDGVGLVIASTLLTVKYLRKGCDCVAAGFLCEQLLPTAAPLPFFAHPFVVLTFTG
jgi:hypothetical protein